MKKHEKIFLIDHALSFRYPDLRKALNDNPKLVSRLLNMLKFLGNKKPVSENQLIEKKHSLAVEYEFLEIEDPLKYEINPECITLSFYGNKIDDLEKIEKLCQKFNKIKALWLNENPVSQKPNLLELIEKGFSNIEIFNSKFTKNAGVWAIRYLINKCDLNKVEENILNENIKYLNLSDRNIFNLGNFEIFKSFPKVKKIELLGHELDSLETTNKFFNFLQIFPKLKEIIVEDSVSEILWTLYSQKKLNEISKTLYKINGFELNYGKPAYQYFKTFYFLLANYFILKVKLKKILNI